MLNFFTCAVVTASTLFSLASALPNISVKGSKLFANGQQFYIKGKLSTVFSASHLVAFHSRTLQALPTKALPKILSWMETNARLMPMP